MICCISPSVMWEYPALPWHVGQVFPACKSSIGPLRKANATSAFASVANRAESPRAVMDFFIGGIVEAGVPHVSHLSRDMGFTASTATKFTCHRRLDSLLYTFVHAPMPPPLLRRKRPTLPDLQLLSTPAFLP